MTLLDTMADDNRAIHSGEFSEPVLISYQSGSITVEVSTTCIFDRTYETIDAQTGAPVMSRNPRISVFLDDLEAETGEKLIDQIANRNVSATVRGLTFAVTEVREDGTGCALLMLHE